MSPQAGSMQPDYNAVIIGGGHNGLACAAQLAQGGMGVLVLEARPMVGGFATTEEPFAGYPGVRMPVAAMDLVTALLPPSIIDTLSLKDHGLKLIEIDPFYSHTRPDGRSFAFWRNLDRTCEEIAKFSKNDALAYRELTGNFLGMWRTVLPYFHAHPIRPGIGTVLRMMRAAISHRHALGRSARVILSSPQSLIEEHFESTEIRAALGNFAAGSALPLNEPGSGIIMALMAMQHEWGVFRPVGGMGAFSEALARAAKSHGAVVRTDSRVDSVMLDQGRAVGVKTSTGETISAHHVIGSIDPLTLFTKMLPKESLSRRVRAELGAIGVWRSNLAFARVDILLSAKPRMVVSAERAQQLLPTSMLLGPDFEATQRYVKAASDGRMEGEIPFWIGSPSLLDRSLVPANSSYETFYTFVPAVPYRLADGGPWSAQREEVAKRVLTTLEKIMPGVTSLVLSVSVRTPEDLERSSGVYRGNAYHVDLSLDQMGPWRPTPSLAGYASPIQGLWHTGAGAHPMGSVNGLSGTIAARTILKHSRRSRHATAGRDEPLANHPAPAR